MKTHHLKCWPEFFTLILFKEKKFEIRLNDRNFQSGDKLLLKEFDPRSNTYTGRTTRVKCGYILKSHPGLKENYVIIQLV